MFRGPRRRWPSSATPATRLDIGGRGLSADAREVYEEGLYIPITKLYRRGRAERRSCSDSSRANVRTPETVLGDIHAQVACNDVGGRRLLEFMDEFGLDSIDPLADEIIERSERAMRAAIDRAAGRRLRERRLERRVCRRRSGAHRCAVTERGDEMSVDYAGSRPQSRRGINVVLNYTRLHDLRAQVRPSARRCRTTKARSGRCRSRRPRAAS